VIRSKAKKLEIACNRIRLSIWVFYGTKTAPGTQFRHYRGGRIVHPLCYKSPFGCAHRRLWQTRGKPPVKSCKEGAPTGLFQSASLVAKATRNGRKRGPHHGVIARTPLREHPLPKPYSKKSVSDRNLSQGHFIIVELIRSRPLFANRKALGSPRLIPSLICSRVL